jgi:hypothetical protein
MVPTIGQKITPSIEKDAFALPFDAPWPVGERWRKCVTPQGTPM